ncbi:MAG: branched-chain amino acid transport system substrate-binding protein [Neolewinella sp.]|jgi:branched-chain amino acid transport system substrate-binding protein
MELHTTRLIRLPFNIYALLISILSLLALTASSSYAHTTRDLTIYLSADRSGAKASGNSIEQGIRTALDEIDYEIGDYKVSLKSFDHRGSTPRAKRHLDAFLQDPTALALYGGLHSPPLLGTRDFINENKILVMVPWAAATPITRYPSAQNWIFRLSIDDSKAGHFITQQSVDKNKFKKVALLLEDTGWGKANHRTMISALKDRQLSPASVTWFNWGISDSNARILMRNIIQTGADSIFMVGNASEGNAFVKAMVSLPKEQRLPIFSHWGITGGDFAEQMAPGLLESIQLSFIQTTFSFMAPLSGFQQSVFDRASQLFPESIQNPQDIKAPNGFIHAYDLTRLLIAAINKNALHDEMALNRNNIKSALENLNTPVQGLIKTYNRPFTTFSPNIPDAHEALDIDDFSMGHYGPNNEIILN